ncbi:Gfo/Idh/MocA family protein [Tenggerimyces flavus]|uniref:Gfo/Idh/MocA family protein n=1 Tax=Tenggerimyces flavus TaxID=1708749 RepID=A0ABV7YL83_9ACTN|nr:Gfo/Idh/MocA family oxidoreductase [Tenggerimyces flavus]MBM7788710.1 putative dehydrogenase [Tenggerimyces flavus]
MPRVGIVGAGIRGRLFAQALAGVQGVEVVGLADSSERVAREAREATGLTVHPSHDELLNESPDAVIVATPDFAHKDAAVAAANAGCALLLEKPVATSLADAYAIRDAVRATGVRCMVGFENRWNPHLVRVGEAVHKGELGAVTSQNYTLSNTYFVPTKMLSWAAKSSPAWFLMPHTTDLAIWLAGSRPASVYASGSRGLLQERGVDTWDVVHALITFENGSTANLTSAWILPESMDGIVDFTFQVIGSNGSVRGDLGHQGLVLATDQQRSLWPVGGTVPGELIGAPVWMARHFVRQLETGADLSPSLDEGVLVTEVICAIERSLASGKVETPG